MAKPECRWECPEQWSEWDIWLEAGLHGRNHWRLSVLLMGILFAQGRKTVTSWLRAAGVSDDFQGYYYFLAPLGRKTKSVATRLFIYQNFWGSPSTYSEGSPRLPFPVERTPQYPPGRS